MGGWGKGDREGTSWSWTLEDEGLAWKASLRQGKWEGREGRAKPAILLDEPATSDNMLWLHLFPSHITSGYKKKKIRLYVIPLYVIHCWLLCLCFIFLFF